MADLSRIRNLYYQHFESKAIFLYSPGRINLLGDHTDYNSGLVMPAAIDFGITFGIGKNNSDEVNIFAADRNERISFNINKVEKSKDKEWANFLLGVIEQFKRSGEKIGGFDLVFGGDLPVCAGLSSSTALECGLSFGLDKIFDLGLSKRDHLIMAHKADKEFMGLNRTYMDQFANLFSVANHIIYLDCKNLYHEHLELEMSSFRFVLFDTQIKLDLNSSEYNARRKACEDALETVQKYLPQAKSLRDLTPETLDKIKNKMYPPLYEKASFIVNEIDRVEEAARDIRKKNWDAFGRKMYASHDGLRDMYKVSCPELDFLVEHSKKFDNIKGARLMGTGFGGCVIALVKISNIEEMINDMKKAYRKKFGKKLIAYKARISNGTSLIS
ncbi:galactokinase [Marinigracilibium pacificum]|uniref:Galactokinase n=1 Tax=Marinigracilibium pacificum TaxID=2729599 RepID=A0A848J5Y7_9BACT|nr:galactokinase [Marinigracilibium pacificum]NMM49884.1 galactokinase [Marinigracilibium pacificum]